MSIRRRAGIVEPVLALMPNSLKLGIDYVNGPWATTAATQQIVKDTCYIQNTHICGFNQSLGADFVGSSTTRTPNDFSTPLQQLNNFNILDNQITNNMAAAQKTGGDLCITLFAAPWFMYGQTLYWDSGDGPTIYDTPLPSSSYDAYSQLCADIAAQYPAVKYFSVWNEYKGFYDSADSRWAYETWTVMYNKIYTAIKAVRSDAQVGGCYMNFSTIPKKSSGTAQSGVPLTAALTSLATQYNVATSIQNTAWYQDGRQLDTYLYFKQNAVGYDFITFDGGIYSKVQTTLYSDYMTAETYTDSSSVVRLNNPTKVAQVATWLNSLFPTEPIWCVESYWGEGGASNCQSFLNHALKSPLDVALIWHQIPGTADLLWDTNSLRTSVGDVFAAHTLRTKP